MSAAPQGNPPVAPATPWPCARVAALVAARGFAPSSGALARAVGITRAHLYRLGADPACNPSWATVCALAEALGVTAAELVGPADPRRPPPRHRIV